MKVVEKKDRLGRVKIFFERDEQWVEDNADWMRENGYTVREPVEDTTGYTEPLPIVDTPEVVEVPQTKTEIFGGWDGEAVEPGNDEEIEYEPSVKRNRRKK